MQRNQKRRLRPHLARALSSRQRNERKVVLRRRDGDDCFYCLQPIVGELGAFTLEHIHRWADGGSNHTDNLALAHKDCNWATRDLSVDQKMLRRGDALLAWLQADQASAA